MSFLGFTSASAQPAVTSPPSLTEAKKISTVTHSRSSPSRHSGARKGRNAILRTFNTAASQPSMLKSIGMPQITALLSTEELLYATTSGIAFVPAALAITLSMFSKSTAYTALFDQYRIDDVEMWIVPNAPQGSTTFSSQYHAIDYDNASLPSDASDITSKATQITTDGASATYLRWQPHMAVALYSGAFTSYGNEPADWIDAGSPNVQHFGVRSGYGPSATGGIVYAYHVRAKVSFRNPGL